MSFFKVTEYEDHKTKVRKVRPSYRNSCPDDLIIRGGAFYAVYLPERVCGPPRNSILCI